MSPGSVNDKAGFRLPNSSTFSEVAWASGLAVNDKAGFGLPSSSTFSGVAGPRDWCRPARRGGGRLCGGRRAIGRVASALGRRTRRRRGLRCGRRHPAGFGGGSLDPRKVSLRQSRIVAVRRGGRLHGGRRLGRRRVGRRAGGLSLATGVAVGGSRDRRRRRAGAASLAAAAFIAAGSGGGNPASSPVDEAGGGTGAGRRVGGRSAASRSASASRLVSPSVVWGTGAGASPSPARALTAVRSVCGNPHRRR